MNVHWLGGIRLLRNGGVTIHLPTHAPCRLPWESDPLASERGTRSEREVTCRRCLRLLARSTDEVAPPSPTRAGLRPYDPPVVALVLVEEVA